MKIYKIIVVLLSKVAKAISNDYWAQSIKEDFIRLWK